jgi:hypothetical protein
MSGDSSRQFRRIFEEEILFDPLALALSRRERAPKRHSAIALESLRPALVGQDFKIYPKNKRE